MNKRPTHVLAVHDDAGTRVSISEGGIVVIPKGDA